MMLPEIPKHYVPRHVSTFNVPPVKRREFSEEYLFTYTMGLPEDDLPFIIGNGNNEISIIITEWDT